MSGYGTSPAEYGPDQAAAIEQVKHRDRKTLLWSLLISAVIIVLLLWRCGGAVHPIAAASDDAVDDFHQKLNNEQYHQIYAEAGPVFTASASEEQYTEFLRGIRNSMGKADSATRESIRIYKNRDGRFATLIYQTKFERGSGKETFTWNIDGEELLLAGYNIEYPREYPRRRRR